MGDRKIRHIESVFNGHESENGKMNDFHAFKKKKAPVPPSGQTALPKIGNYQPKILLDVAPLSRGSRSSEDYSRKRSSSPPRRREMIMGDKDVPLQIEMPVDDTPVAPPRRKRRAPDAPQPSNPLYGRSLSAASDEEELRMDFETQGGDFDFGPGLDNPGFRPRDSYHGDAKWDAVDEQISQSQDHRPKNKSKSVIPEPAPDYDDEEVTINFDEENDTFVLDYNNKNIHSNRKPINAPVYKDFEGEDYGLYLEDDDDYEFDMRSAVSSPARPQGKYRPKKGVKPNKKYNKPMSTSSKRNTIRDFSFSDSKIGWGDRTVKSTSAKGRQIKRENDRRRMNIGDVADGRPGKPSKGSYEEFLSVRNGFPLESPNSSDSGVEIEEAQKDMFYHSQPKQMRTGRYSEKPTMWQRLTWRFKKSVTVTKVDDRF